MKFTQSNFKGVSVSLSVFDCTLGLVHNRRFEAPHALQRAKKAPMSVSGRSLPLSPATTSSLIPSSLRPCLGPAQHPALQAVRHRFLSARHTSTQLASDGSWALQSRIIGSFGDACDYFLAGGLVRSGIRHEDSNCNASSVWEWDEPDVVGRMRHSIVYVGGSRFVSDMHFTRQIAVQTTCPD
jgi:hypothetical protein